MVIAPGTYVTLHKTILQGFNAEFMRWSGTTGRWNNKRKIGGFLLRGFGLRFMIYRDRG